MGGALRFGAEPHFLCCLGILVHGEGTKELAQQRIPHTHHTTDSAPQTEVKGAPLPTAASCRVPVVTEARKAMSGNSVEGITDAGRWTQLVKSSRLVSAIPQSWASALLPPSALATETGLS